MSIGEITYDPVRALGATSRINRQVRDRGWAGVLIQFDVQIAVSAGRKSHDSQMDEPGVFNRVGTGFLNSGRITAINRAGNEAQGISRQ